MLRKKAKYQFILLFIFSIQRIEALTRISIIAKRKKVSKKEKRKKKQRLLADKQ